MRLIDAESTKNLARENFTDQTCLVAAVALIDEAETVDAVQVVRCRECEHWADWGACGHPKNGFDAPPMGPNDFCSHGKRMKKD